MCFGKGMKKKKIKKPEAAWGSDVPVRWLMKDENELKTPEQFFQLMDSYHQEQFKGYVKEEGFTAELIWTSFRHKEGGAMHVFQLINHRVVGPVILAHDWKVNLHNSQEHKGREE